MLAAMALRGSLSLPKRSLTISIPAFSAHAPDEKCPNSTRGYSTMQRQVHPPTLDINPQRNNFKQNIRTNFSPSSFSGLPPDEEEKEYNRVASLTDYQKEMELRNLDADLARLQTLRDINTGDLYTIRGKFKILARDYGMPFMAWYWACWFATAGLTYAAVELGGVDPVMVMSKADVWLESLGSEPGALSSRVDPELGKIGIVLVLNECLEPIRLPFVVMTTKPIVNAFKNS